MKILSLSDETIPIIYSSQVRRRFGDVSLILGCGDLSYLYLEYVLTALNVPLFFVRGNHDKIVEYSSWGQRTAPAGGVDLHRQVCNYRGLLLAGVSGSLRYRPGPFQYTQGEMFRNVFSLVPRMLANRIQHGRFLDIFITHAPPFGIHDETDRTHTGIKAFRWLDRMFQPAYHIHGHMHIYRPDTVTETRFGKTRVINTYPYKEITLDFDLEEQAVGQSEPGRI